MLDQLINLDKTIFLFFNAPHWEYWDHVMWVYTGKFIWLPLILSFVFVFFKRNWKEALLVTLMMILVATLCDQFSSTLCKPFFSRFRPSQDPEFSPLVTIVNGYRGGRFGFISGHAANSFGLFTFTALVFRNKLFTFTALLWAILTCYSRVYLGVHYPGDILAGAASGLFFGFLVYQLYVYIHRYLYEKHKLPTSRLPYQKDPHVKWVIYTIYASFAFILLISPWMNFRL